MRRIVAIGGGGFTTESAPSLLDEYLVRVAGARRICFIPTASGDAHDDLEKFYRAFARFPADLSHLAFFRSPRPGAVALAGFERALAVQDLIYVGGGNTRSMLAVWRDWGVPQALRNAYAGGTTLAGVSAGAICWFEWGASDSASPGTAGAPLRGLGFLRGSCSPHWGGEAHRRREFHAMVRRGDVPAGYGLSDGAALLFEDGRAAEAVAAHPAAGVFRVECSAGRLRETPLPVRRLVPAPQPSARRTG